MTHHPFGPSKLRQRELCPGSYRAEEGLPEVPSDVADMGTELHRCVPPGIDISHLSSDDQGLVKQCGEVIKRYWGGAISTHYEQRLSLTNSAGVEMSPGTADFVAIEEGRAIVIDWKFGYLPSEPDSLQVATYAAAAMQTYNKFEGLVVLLNPRLMAEPVEFHFTAKDVAKTIDRIKAIRAAAEAPDAPLVPSEQACRYCLAAPTCPALREAALVPVKADPTPATIPHERAAEYLGYAKLAEKWAKAVKEAVKRDALALQADGHEPQPGIAIQTNRGNRKITDPQAAFDRLSHRLSPKQFMSMCKPSVKQLEDNFIKSYAVNGGTQKERRELFGRMMADLITRSDDTVEIHIVENSEIDLDGLLNVGDSDD